MGNLIKRRPIIAFFLSLITPGLGQMYNGKLQKGIVFFVIYEFLLIMFHIFSGLRFEFHGLVLFFASGAILLGFFLFVLSDAFKGISKLRVTVLKPYHRWYFYVGIFAAVLIINEIILESILPDTKNFKPYRNPSSAMGPTLLVGDRFIADMKIYKRERPKRGDIIILEYPKDPSKDFIKRVIGLENEKIEIIQNKIYINDELIDDPWGYFEESKLAGYMQELENFSPVIIPRESFFVLGDNRYNSMDSRFFGSVELTKIKGKVLYIYWAKNKSRIGMQIK